MQMMMLIPICCVAIKILLKLNPHLSFQKGISSNSTLQDLKETMETFMESLGKLLREVGCAFCLSPRITDTVMFPVEVSKLL